MGCINSSNKKLYALKRDDIFNVSVVRVQSEHPIVLARQGFLEITPHDVIFIAPDHEPIVWALHHLRRYGLTGNIFSFEAGRRCSTGPGIYTFRCCNADEFYAKFQRCINSVSNLVHPSHLFGRLDGHQPHTNQYLEPTFVQGTAPIDERTALTGSLNNVSNDFNLNSPDSMHSSLTAEIVNFVLPVQPYSNVSPNAHITSSNIYMEQPIRINNEHNNNVIANNIADGSNVNNRAMLNQLSKSSSLDVPPEECAPILANPVALQRLYENIDTSAAKSTNSQNNFNNLSDRCYANVELSSRPDNDQKKSFQLDLLLGQQSKPTTSLNAPIVNYIILDLNQPRSPSQCSPKDDSGSVQSFSGSGGYVAVLKKEELSSAVGSLSCGSSTMPKGSTISGDSGKLHNNKIETSGSYTRIDFLKTFALMKSSTNYMDFDVDNDQEESRITRHSKFVRKAYSISE